MQYNDMSKEELLALKESLNKELSLIHIFTGSTEYDLMGIMEENV